MEGDENKGALGKTRVGDIEAGLANDQVSIEDDVEIERARAIGRAGDAVAAEFALEGEKRAEKLEGGEIGFKSDDGIEKARLLGEAGGRGGVERGARRDVADGGEASGGSGERGFRRAGRAIEVGAKSDKCDGHADVKISGVGGVGGVIRNCSSGLSHPFRKERGKGWGNR